jgi:type IV pilus assembly protein PilE
MKGKRMAREQGVTLIELMVVVVVVAVLASIAVPSYRSYMLRAQRSDARAELLRVRTAQEKFFLQNNSYTGDFGPAGLNMIAAAGATMPSEHGSYTIAVAADVAGRPAPNFDVTATAIVGQLEDAVCRTFSTNELGQVTSTDSGGADSSGQCWR